MTKKERAYLDDKILLILREGARHPTNSPWRSARETWHEMDRRPSFDVVRRRLEAIAKREERVTRQVVESYQSVNSWNFGGAAVCKRKTAEYKWIEKEAK